MFPPFTLMLPRDQVQHAVLDINGFRDILQDPKYIDPLTFEIVPPAPVYQNRADMGFDAAHVTR